MKKKRTRLAPQQVVVPAEVTVPGVSDEDKLFAQGWQPVTTVRSKNSAESVRVGKAIRAVPKECYFNARKTVLRLEEYAASSYFEGWAVTNLGIAIEHAWVVRDGIVVDPTLPTEVVAYFPGLEFQGRSGIEDFLRTPKGKKCKKTPFFYAFGWGGHLSPTFEKALKDCTAFAIGNASRQ